MQNDNDLGNGYEFMPNRGDNLHIRKAGKVIIDSTIVELDTAVGYVAGLRLPAEHLSCNGGNKIRLKNSKHFFIIATQTDEVWQYDNYDQFQGQLNALGLAAKLTFNYSLLDTTWTTYAKYYKNIDFSNCEIIPHK